MACIFRIEFISLVKVFGSVSILSCRSPRHSAHAALKAPFIPPAAKMTPNRLVSRLSGCLNAVVDGVSNVGKGAGEVDDCAQCSHAMATAASPTNGMMKKMEVIIAAMPS